jgi:hypothetical protein
MSDIPPSPATRAVVRPDVEKARRRLQPLMAKEVPVICEARTHRVRVTPSLAPDLLGHVPDGQDDHRMLAALRGELCACDEAARAWADRDFERLPPRLRRILEAADLLTLLEGMAGSDGADRS